jgi:hypothetical protein
MQTGLISEKNNGTKRTDFCGKVNQARGVLMIPDVSFNPLTCKRAARQGRNLRFMIADFRL